MSAGEIVLYVISWLPVALIVAAFFVAGETTNW